MKTLTGDELDALNRVKEDINITIESNFSSFGPEFVKNLTSLSPIFSSLFFKILNHNPENKDWKNRDRVFATNNFSNIVKNITKIHSGYEKFDNLKAYLELNSFEKVENSFAEAIGHHISTKDSEDKHQRYYYVVGDEKDIFANLSSLEYIYQNKIHNIITILYTKSSNEELNKENRLNAKLMSFGFDTLVVTADNVGSVCDAIVYAKKLKKPTIILGNVS
ncbi:MAG: hypothetical protein WCO35_03945 [Candidatus Nomurabacteria bacterium]